MKQLTPISSSFLDSSRLRVLVDCDGVIVDLVVAWVAAIRVATGLNILEGWRPSTWDIAKELGLSKKQDEAVHDLMRQPGMAAHLPAFSGAINAVKSIAETEDVLFVTTPVPGSKTWCGDRIDWLQREFGEELAERYVFCDSKFVVYGDILIDDKPENCKDFQRAWPVSIALHWLSPGMSPVEGLINVNDWDTVHLYIRRYKENKLIRRVGGGL